MSTIEQIDRNNVPQHVAIIMDGNGRWAMKQQHQRLFGHQSALDAVRAAVEASANIGVKYLTLYTFSTENWNRPQEEVDGLMELLITAVRANSAMLLENNVRLRIIGDFMRIPERSRNELQSCIDLTSQCTGTVLILALSYSARWEIAEALRKALREGLDPETINEESIRPLLSTAEYPDPDLLIRTGGELRVSNFLLWQIAYSEFYFTELLWPDFRHEDFYQAVFEYQQRQRRFGKTEAQIENGE